MPLGFIYFYVHVVSDMSPVQCNPSVSTTIFGKLPRDAVMGRQAYQILAHEAILDRARGVSSRFGVDVPVIEVPVPVDRAVIRENASFPVQWRCNRLTMKRARVVVFSVATRKNGEESQPEEILQIESPSVCQSRNLETFTFASVSPQEILVEEPSSPSFAESGPASNSVNIRLPLSSRNLFRIRVEDSVDSEGLNVTAMGYVFRLLAADEVFQEGDVDALGQPISDDLVVKNVSRDSSSSVAAWWVIVLVAGLVVAGFVSCYWLLLCRRRRRRHKHRKSEGAKKAFEEDTVHHIPIYSWEGHHPQFQLALLDVLRLHSVKTAKAWDLSNVKRGTPIGQRSDTWSPASGDRNEISSSEPDGSSSGDIAPFPVLPMRTTTPKTSAVGAVTDDVPSDVARTVPSSLDSGASVVTPNAADPPADPFTSSPITTMWNRFKKSLQSKSIPEQKPHSPSSLLPATLTPGEFLEGQRHSDTSQLHATLVEPMEAHHHSELLCRVSAGGSLDGSNPAVSTPGKREVQLPFFPQQIGTRSSPRSWAVAPRRLGSPFSRENRRQPTMATEDSTPWSANSCIATPAVHGPPESPLPELSPPPWNPSALAPRSLVPLQQQQGQSPSPAIAGLSWTPDWNSPRKSLHLATGDLADNAVEQRSSSESTNLSLRTPLRLLLSRFSTASTTSGQGENPVPRGHAGIQFCPQLVPLPDTPDGVQQQQQHRLPSLLASTLQRLASRRCRFNAGNDILPSRVPSPTHAGFPGSPCSESVDSGSDNHRYCPRRLPVPVSKQQRKGDSTLAPPSVFEVLDPHRPAPYCHDSWSRSRGLYTTLSGERRATALSAAPSLPPPPPPPPPLLMPRSHESLASATHVPPLLQGGVGSRGGFQELPIHQSPPLSPQSPTMLPPQHAVAWGRDSPPAPTSRKLTGSPIPPGQGPRTSSLSRPFATGRGARLLEYTDVPETLSPRHHSVRSRENLAAEDEEQGTFAFTFAPGSSSHNLPTLNGRQFPP